MKQIFVVLCQDWEKDNAPDGYSLHISETSKKQFIVSEDDFGKPTGPTYEIEVSKDVFEKVKRLKNLRSLGKPPVPGCIMTRIR